jgi:hypothetical protein
MGGPAFLFSCVKNTLTGKSRASFLLKGNKLSSPTVAHGENVQAAKHILSLMLVFTVLFSGLPLFSPEDANHDTRIDLGDAILRVKDLARTAESLEGFTLGFENALSALTAVAGLKTSLQPPRKTQSVESFPSITASNTFLVYFISYPSISEKISTYESVVQLMPTPPPKT